jgi:hypothetical protein
MRGGMAKRGSAALERWIGVAKCCFHRVSGACLYTVAQQLGKTDSFDPTY